MSFIIDKIDLDNRLVVREKSTGWFFPVESKIQAEVLCDKFNEIENKPLDLHKNFEEWDKYIDNVIIGEKNLINLKQEFEEQSQEIIANTDFKELYGANNQKVRDNHVKKELGTWYDTIKDLEFSIDWIGRRISFLRELIRVKRTIMESKN